MTTTKTLNQKLAEAYRSMYDKDEEETALNEVASDREYLDNIKQSLDAAVQNIAAASLAYRKLVKLDPYWKSKLGTFDSKLGKSVSNIGWIQKAVEILRKG